EPLQNMINAYAYGDVWSRSALPLKTKSLAAIAMTAAIGRANELRVHVNGALTNGFTAEEIRDILLLVALYSGIPAAIEGHRIALDVVGERGGAGAMSALGTSSVASVALFRFWLRSVPAAAARSCGNNRLLYMTGNIPPRERPSSSHEISLRSTGRCQQ